MVDSIVWPSSSIANSAKASFVPLPHVLPPQTILPELWDTAVDLFDASRAGVVSDRKRTQKVQEKVRDEHSVFGALNVATHLVPHTRHGNLLCRNERMLLPPVLRGQVMNKYLKRKYRELKMYVKNGWWGYARPAPRSGRQDASMSEGMKLLSRRLVLRPLLFFESFLSSTALTLIKMRMI